MRKTFFLIIIAFCQALYSQTNFNSSNEPAFPFLTISTNARTGAMGEVNVVSSSFYKDAGFHLNPALLSRKGKYFGTQFSCTSWMNKIVDNVTLKEANGFYSIDSKSTIGVNYRRMKFGEVTITNEYGEPLITSNPYELSLQIVYSRQIKKNFAYGISVKYLRNNFGDSYSIINPQTININSIAMDFGFEGDSELKILKNSKLNIHYGASITNFGPKVRYTEDPDIEKIFLPTKLGVGLLVNPDFYFSESLRLNIDIAYQADKLLIPSFNSSYDTNISATKAFFQSFYDAPGGLQEELKEIIHKLGSEIRVNYQDIGFAAIRFGKNKQNESKGITFDTYGFGIGLYGFSFDYKKIASDMYTIDNSWSITLSYRSRIEKLFRF